MRLKSLTTVRTVAQRNLCFVILELDDGVSGLGESFYAAEAVETYLHTSVAPILFGLEDVSPEAVAQALRPYTGYQGSGVETRANGAVDVALWDLLGKESGLSLSALLGGKPAVDVPVYNTCAGARYMSATSFQNVSNWGVEDADEYEDLYAFLTRPGKLARELLELGFLGMKVWPFDEAAERSGGNDIDSEGLRFGIDVISAIREEVGDAMEVMVELHGLWSPRPARTILSALEPFEIYWVEDPIRADNVKGLVNLKAETEIPIAVGETVAGQRHFRRMLEASALDVATVDIGWTGGLTEARKVASACESYGIPIAPHDCTGPVSLAVASHLTNVASNGLIQEVARAFLHTWYRDLVDGLPELRDGRLVMRNGPGHGVNLREDVAAQEGVVVRESSRDSAL